MGMIKLPNNSLDFFSENYNDIFQSGELAEGKWNKKISDWSCEYTAAPYALAVNSNACALSASLSLFSWATRSCS